MVTLDLDSKRGLRWNSEALTILDKNIVLEMLLRRDNIASCALEQILYPHHV